MKNTNLKLRVSREFTWSNEQITALGVVLAAEEMKNENYEPIFRKAKNVMKLWRQRELSLCGKVTLVNSLVGSLFVYRMTVAPAITQKIAMQFENKLSDFIWNGKKP